MELKATIYLHPKQDRATIARLNAGWSHADLAGAANATASLIGMWLNGRRGIDLQSVRWIEEFTGLTLVPPLDEVPLYDPEEVQRRRTA